MIEKNRENKKKDDTKKTTHENKMGKQTKRNDKSSAEAPERHQPQGLQKGRKGTVPAKRRRAESSIAPQEEGRETAPPNGGGGRQHHPQGEGRRRKQHHTEEEEESRHHQKKEEASKQPKRGPSSI